MVIPLIYDNASCFSEGLAAVNKKGLWGFINSSGNEVIPFKYSYAVSFYQGSGKVLKASGKWYYIDKSGKESLVTE